MLCLVVYNTSSYCSDDMSMERRNFYLPMGDEKIWKTVPSFKQTRSKEMKLRQEQTSEEALHEINYPLRLQVRFPLVDFIMNGIVKYQAAMPAKCHSSHAASFGTKIFLFHVFSARLKKVADNLKLTQHNRKIFFPFLFTRAFIRRK